MSLNGVNVGLNAKNSNNRLYLCNSLLIISAVFLIEFFQLYQNGDFTTKEYVNEIIFATNMSLGALFLALIVKPNNYNEKIIRIYSFVEITSYCGCLLSSFTYVASVARPLWMYGMFSDLFQFLCFGVPLFIIRLSYIVATVVILRKLFLNFKKYSSNILTFFDDSLFLFLSYLSGIVSIIIVLVVGAKNI